MVWRIKRMEPPTGNLAIECTGTDIPTQVTMEDTSGAVADTVLQICRPNNPDPCTFLNLLGDAGFLPGDWADLCTIIGP